MIMTVLHVNSYFYINFYYFSDHHNYDMFEFMVTTYIASLDSDIYIFIQ